MSASTHAIVESSARPAAGTGDLFVLHPLGRPDVCLALTGQDLLRLKVVLDGLAATPRRDDLLEAAAAIGERLGGYFDGLR